MSIITISSRLLRRQTSIFCIKNVSHERLNLRFKSRIDIIDNPTYGQSDYSRLNQPIGIVGYILLGVPIGTFMLGTWQIERRKQKLELMENMKKRTKIEPQPLPEDLKKLEEMEYCPIKVRGEFLYEKEFAIALKSLIKDGAGVSEKGGGIFSSKSNMGYNLITPFKVENRNVTILVNRGWVPSKISKLSKEQLGHVTGTVEITGLVRLNETRQSLMPRNTPTAGVFIYRDVLTMAYLADTDPVFIDLVDGGRVPGGPIAGQTRISLRNEHLSYIFTWYSLSILTALMWYRLYIKKLPLL